MSGALLLSPLASPRAGATRRTCASESAAKEAGRTAAAAAVLLDRAVTASPSGPAPLPDTPPALPSLAPASPSAGVGEVLTPCAAAVTAAVADAQAAAAAAACRTAAMAGVWRRAAAFMNATVRSPVVQAALCALEAGSLHPAPCCTDSANPGVEPSLHWTLAAMLALFLKAGYNQGDLRGC